MNRKNIRFGVVTILLIAVISFCIAGTVRGQEKLSDESFRSMEAELLNDMRMYLDQNGFQNSGVTLNRVVDADGTRQYTFLIHHRKIDRMEDGERELFKEELAARCAEAAEDFPGDICSFRQEFLIMKNAG